VARILVPLGFEFSDLALPRRLYVAWSKRLISVHWALTLGIFGAAALALASPAIPETPESAQIIQNYLAASQAHQGSLRGASMEVDIDASVPQLKKQGKLHALRNISKLGQITYKILGFQGDNTIKKEVIARYLSAEQQSQGDERMAVTPDNYKFKYKGKQTLQSGGKVFVFQLVPRKKAVGLFKGEVWLDAETYLPMLEKGRFVKNPTVFFRNVDFERDYRIENGMSIPQHMNSVIETRVVGKVELNISYTNFEPESVEPADPLLSTFLE
jgi:hypothetical protein